MKVRSMRRRGISALASVALGAGALAVPTLMIASSPANAAAGPINYTCNLALEGGFASYGGERAATLTFDTDAPEALADGETASPVLTAKLRFAQEYIDLFQPSPVNKMGGTMTATTDTSGAAGTVALTFEQWNRDGGMGTPVEAFDMTATGTWSELTGGSELELGVSDLAGDLYIGTSFGTSTTTVPTTCTPVSGEATVVDVIGVDAEEEFVSNAVCTIDLTESGFGGVSAYPANIDATATLPATGTVGEATDIPVAAEITMGPDFSDYLAGSPTYKLSGTVVPDLAVGSDAATGGDIVLSEWLRDLALGSPIGQPVDELVALAGSGTAKVTPTVAGAQTATLAGLTGSMAMTVTFGDATMDAPLDCALDEAAEIGVIDVEAAPVVVAATKTSVKAKYKKKKATITVTVKAGKTAATGKVKITVKKGKKKVVAKNATINKKGKAKLVVKKNKLKKKGKYKITATYPGSADFAASSGKGSFKVK